MADLPGGPPGDSGAGSPIPSAELAVDRKLLPVAHADAVPGAYESLVTRRLTERLAASALQPTFTAVPDAAAPEVLSRHVADVVRRARTRWRRDPRAPSSSGEVEAHCSTHVPHPSERKTPSSAAMSTTTGPAPTWLATIDVRAPEASDERDQ